MDPAIVFLVNLIIWVLVIGVLLYCLRWAMGYLTVPDPVQKIIWVVVAIVLLISALRLLVGVGGQPVHLFGQQPVVIQQR